MNTNKTNTIETEFERIPDQTKNLAGGEAFNLSDKVKLYNMVACWMVREPKFYNDSTDEDSTTNVDRTIFETIDRVVQHDPEFVLKLAVYCRNELYLRTAPQVLLGEVALASKGTPKPLVRKATPRIVRRADELMSVIAYIQSKIGNIGSGSPQGSLPASLKRGLADAFHNFKEYHFAKYDNRNRAVKIEDVFKLVHPGAKDDTERALYKKIIEKTLKSEDTWESIISNDGSNKESWNKAVKVMPFMAGLRNVRNLLQNEADLTPILEKLTNKEVVLKSKQFPFRFFNAYRSVQQACSGFDSQKVLNAIESAMELSVENIPEIKGNTILASDCSGSMTMIRGRSITKPAEIAGVMFAIANRICENSLSYLFDDQVYQVNPAGRAASILQYVSDLTKQFNGGATYGHLVIDNLIAQNIKAGRIIFFSDFQMYADQGWQGNVAGLQKSIMEYRRKVNPDFRVYSIDVCGYGSTQTPENDPKSLMVAGFSEKLLKYIPLFESDGATAIKDIEAIEL